jgi:Tol biopolymer transport system component
MARLRVAGPDLDMSVNGKRRRALTPGADYGPAWSPDRGTVFFSHDVP